jgi:hypothetical protein
MTETFMPYKVSALERLKETFIDRLSRRLFFALMKDFKIGKITLINDRSISLSGISFREAVFPQSMPSCVQSPIRRI